jgi:hypothetical protein
VEILDNGLQVSHGEFEYLWLQVRDELGINLYRAIALRELITLSIDDTEIEDYNIFGRQWSLVRGMYNAQVDFVYTAAGIFTPLHVGVVQFYGAAANGATKDEAANHAMNRLGAVEGALSNFQQSKTRSPKLDWIEWYLEFVTQRARNITSLLGHPDPRDARRGINLDGMPLNDDLASEQNEILFRGLAKLREDFVFQVTADRLHRERLTQATFRLAQLTSNVASRRRGAISIGASLSIPLAAALSNSVGSNRTTSESEAHSVQNGQSHGWGESHTDSYAHTESESHTTGGSETHGIAVSHSDGISLSESESQALSRAETHGHSVAQSESDTVARTSGRGSSWSSGGGGSWSQTESQNWGQSQGQQQSQSQSKGQSQSANQSHASSQSQGESSSHQVSSSSGNSHTEGEGYSNSMTAGVSGSAGIPGVVSGGAYVSGTVGKSGNESDTVSASIGVSDAAGVSSSQAQSQGSGSSQSRSSSQSQSQGQSQSQSQGGSRTQASGGSWSSSRGGSNFSSTSRSHTEGRTETETHSQTQGRTNTRGTARSTQSADSITESHSWTKSWAHMKGQSNTWGQSDSEQESWSESHTEGLTNAVALGRGGTLGLTRGFSTGLVPGIHINRSWQTEDHVADRLTKVLLQLQEMFDEAAHGGGFRAEAVLFTASERGAVAAESLAPQAFHGPNTPTPVMTITPDGEEMDLVFKHALAFTPSQAPSPGDFMGGLLGGRFSTVLTTQQLAAYTAPAIFREGTVRVIPAIPKKGLGFYPDMPGEVMLGHQFSPETGDLTNASVKLALKRFMHTMFAGATGFGKSVGAERMAYEIVLNWNMRVVVLDFGAGWRKLLNAPGMEDKVDIRQLTPHGVRPLRWNPLQISRFIVPEVQLASFVDIFGNVAQLGVKQQKHRFYDAVEALYLQHGVLVNDPKIRKDSHWGQVQKDEVQIAIPGTHLDELSGDECQALAVHRSKACSLQDLFILIEKRRDALNSRDQIGRGILDGILERMQTLLRGATARQFAAGQDAIDVADLGDEAGKRLLVLEGGKFLDQFSKAWLLSWAGWLIYQDMVQQRERQLIGQDAELVMVFEEANIIFTGMNAADENNTGAVTVAEQYDNMFRDSRKYGVRFVVITQSPSLIPAGVRSSCSSVFLGYLADPKDKDIALAALAKSEKGFVDEPWRRFLADEGIGMMLGRLPYAMDRAQMRPFLMQPLILNAQEPTDMDIAAHLGRIQL